MLRRRRKIRIRAFLLVYLLSKTLRFLLFPLIAFKFLLLPRLIFLFTIILMKTIVSIFNLFRFII